MSSTRSSSRRKTRGQAATDGKTEEGTEALIQAPAPAPAPAPAVEQTPPRSTRSRGQDVVGVVAAQQPPLPAPAPAPAPAGPTESILSVFTGTSSAAPQSVSADQAGSNDMDQDPQAGFRTERINAATPGAITSRHTDIVRNAFGQFDVTLPTSWIREVRGEPRPTRIDLLNVYLGDELVGFCLLSYIPTGSSSSSSELPVKKMDIWTVCKDLQKTNVRGVVNQLMISIAGLPLVDDHTQLFLIVDSRNTPDMTEFGRLTLYTRYGFRLTPQFASLLTGEDIAILGHSDPNRVATSQFGDVYVGAIQSNNAPLEMVASGKSLKAGPATLAHMDPLPTPAGVEPTQNNFDQAVFKVPRVSYLSLYHMGMIRRANAPDVLKTFRVPPNVTIVTFTMPGSVSFTSIGQYQTILNQIMQSPDKYTQFVKKFRGYSQFPLRVIDKATVTSGADNYATTLKIAQILKQFQTRPIVTLCKRPKGTNQPPLELPDITVKNPTTNLTLPSEFTFKASLEDVQRATSGIYKVQLDIQSYAPGMECFDYQMTVNAFDPVDYTKSSYMAATDYFYGSTTLVTVAGQPVRNLYSGMTPLLARGTTLEAFAAWVGALNGDVPVTLFVVGCAGVPPPPGAGTTADFSAFYEIAHRRALNYHLPFDGFPANVVEYLTTPIDRPAGSVDDCNSLFGDVGSEVSLLSPGRAGLMSQSTPTSSQRNMYEDSGPSDESDLLISEGRDAVTPKSLASEFADGTATLIVGDRTFDLTPEQLVQSNGIYTITAPQTKGRFQPGGASSSEAANSVDATLVIGETEIVGRYSESTSGGRRLPSLPTRRAKRSSSSSKKGYTRRRRALRS